MLLQALNAKQVEMFQSNTISWFVKNGRSFPWRETRNPFHILIAEILLKLTGAWKVEQVYELIVEKFSAPDYMASANPKELTNLIMPLGLHSRAILLIDVAKQLSDQFNGEVPRTYTELTNLKGVGQYTANAILCFAYGKRVPLIDGNISRVFNRCFGLSKNKGAYRDKQLWHIALEFLPYDNYCEYNFGLLDIGALVCVYRKPHCNICPFLMLCREFSNNSQ